MKHFSAQPYDNDRNPSYLGDALISTSASPLKLKPAFALWAILYPNATF